MRSTVTLSDVAAGAGVSIATASRALTGKPRVSREMMHRVRTVAANLGYRVDPNARALRDGSTRLVGMVVPVISLPFHAYLITAVEDALSQSGWELLLADSHNLVEQEMRRLRMFGDRRVDGILLIAADRTGSMPAIATLSPRIPVVTLDRTTDRPMVDHVTVDNEAGLELLFEHLAERKVSCVGYAGTDDASTSGVERWQAFNRLSRRHNFRVGPTFRGDYSIATGTAAAEYFLRSGPLPDAIVSSSDEIALGLLSKLRERGVDVPRDVKITGFDGGPPAQVCWPRLTTVVQPMSSIASDAVSMLIARIKGDTEALRRDRLAPSLQIGAST